MSGRGDCRTPLITGADRRYLPGVRALANSFYANAGPGFRLYCIVHGDEALADDIAMAGAEPIFAPAWDVALPTTEAWPQPLPAMYSRLLIPQMFPDSRRAVWIDSDCIIVKPIAELAELRFSEPVGAVSPLNHSAYSLDYQVGGLTDGGGTAGILAGLLVFNVAEWIRQRITERCAELMRRDDLDFRFVVQSVLSLALRSNFHRLDPCWQGFANREPGNDRAINENHRILHWIGANPWEVPMPNKEIWDRYA